MRAVEQERHERGGLPEGDAAELEAGTAAGASGLTSPQEEREADIAESRTLQQMARAQRERLKRVQDPLYEAEYVE